MDDLYNNAWGESVQVDEQDAPTTKATATLSSLSLKPSWLRTVSPSIGPSHTVEDSEADLAAPSWSTGADIRWNEPSEDSHGFGWSHTEPDMAWGTSTYDSIHIGKSAAKETKIITEDGLEAATLSPTSTLTASEPEEELPQDTKPESPPRIPVPIPIPSRSSSPDGFGGFSSGFETSDDTAPYKAGVVGDIEEDTWGSAWNNAAEEKSDDEAEVEDEWTAARRRKENFDRRIPSGYVDDIKEHCEHLFKSLTAKVDPKQIDDDKDSFRNNLRATLDDLDDLTVIRHQYLPDLTLQPPLNFPKTATYKVANEASHSLSNISKHISPAFWAAAAGFTLAHTRALISEAAIHIPSPSFFTIIALTDSHFHVSSDTPSLQPISNEQIVHIFYESHASTEYRRAASTVIIFIPRVPFLVTYVIITC
ncbi:hypothetical protein EUX98_g3467 [Antrodiella citrinella]|uniref:Uncharacterized protein n=1 Tax=Antrodiella citrinella TaxID=2447956 RepID=A0A4S4MYL3_9APHY|nr:hypothetical protein EUX98_g3467 [Antrodiella citrinella]